jgi:toxin YoeB
MRITFTPSAWDDYTWFQENDRKLLKRINLLIRDCTRTPFEGIGKPEPLKGGIVGSLVAAHHAGTSSNLYYDR